MSAHPIFTAMFADMGATGLLPKPAPVNLLETLRHAHDRLTAGAEMTCDFAFLETLDAAIEQVSVLLKSHIERTGELIAAERGPATFSALLQSPFEHAP